MRTLINGLSGDSILAADRGLAYGDGVFETVRVVNGRPILLELHLARLNRGCKRLGLDLDSQCLQDEVQALCTGSNPGDQILKIIVTRGIGGRGYRSDNIQQANRYISINAYVFDAQMSQTGCALHLCETTLARQPLLAGIKHLNRLEQVLAAAELPADYQEGLMRDTRGHMIEGIRSNLFIVTAGALITPDLSNSGVCGVMRELICQLLPVQIKALDLGAVLAAEEVFVCNSVFGIYPVTRIDAAGQPLATFPVGRVTQACQDQVTEFTGVNLR
ncbi:MAG: aminodeoxychorismate lyase [SAR86 cluster bacterium]